MLEMIQQHIRKESFYPTLLGLVSNPAYIIRRGLWKTILMFAPRIRGRVLDFGCGSKPYESLFSGAESYTGVDIKVSGHQHSDSKVDVYYDGRTLPFEDCHFDAVVSFEVFEHVFNLPEILDEVCRVTKESGLLLLSVPFAWEEHEIPYDYARYTSFAIIHLLSSHGYNIIEARKTTTYMLAVWQMFIAYLERVGPTRGILRYLFQTVIICPFTIVGYMLNAILPKTYEYFGNMVVLARKQASNTREDQLCFSTISSDCE
ncbi:MAG TPA: methyltransferase domain-containing protein [Alloacidobacterium sp.]|nr:methyltransferase domain-containing protein [Alloacidobacterium sp.]